MIILRNQTLSIFDISKRKTIIDFSNYGYFKKATIPFFVAASFFDLSIKERGHREIKKSIYNYCHKKCGDAAATVSAAPHMAILLCMPRSMGKSILTLKNTA